MSLTCSECGAPLPKGSTCQSHFHTLLALEQSILGGPGAMTHFLAVTSYNLQHPSAFVPEARVSMRAALEAALAGRVTIADLRRQARQAFDGPVRVLRARGVTPGDGTGEGVAGWPREWPLTVLDVCYAPPEQAVYAERVQVWAEVVAATLREADVERKR